MKKKEKYCRNFQLLNNQGMLTNFQTTKENLTIYQNRHHYSPQSQMQNTKITTTL